MRANQIVSGLTLTIFAGVIGLSSYIGESNNLGGIAGRHQFNDINVLGLKGVPVLGPILFHQSALVYLSWLVVVGRAALPVPNPRRACTCARWGRRRRPPTPWAST